MIKEFFNNYIIDFVSNKRADNYRQKNKLVLASCYLFILPFFFILTTKLNERLLLIFIAGSQVLLSIAGDYYFIEDPNIGRKITLIDRFLALLYGIYLIFYLIKDNFIITLICISTIIFFIEYSRKSKTFEIWVNRHILWHLICNIIVLFLLNIMRVKDQAVF